MPVVFARAVDGELVAVRECRRFFCNHGTHIYTIGLKFRELKVKLCVYDDGCFFARTDDGELVAVRLQAFFCNHGMI